MKALAVRPAARSVELLEHPERLRAMSAAARSFAAQGFARETCARRIEAAYDAVLA